jgi:hypothetical protein
MTVALEMFCSSFQEKEDHDSIKAAMDSFPTVGIYMYVIAGKKKQGKKKQPKARTIFKYQGVSCVCALNFFRDSAQHTQVLWLATTLEAPPVTSIHSIWQRHQLAYLLCILIKQHTGIGTGTLDHSTLSLQASSQRTNPTCNFYVSLGFLSHDSNDKGLSMTSQEFQEKVKQYPKVWITPEKSEMALFRLIKGCIKLLTVFDLTRSKLESDPTWKTYTYCKFPYACDSMEKIESFANDLPILKSFFLSSHPLTHHPLECKRSASSISGLIMGDRRVKMTSSSWLSTDDIQFLFAFLMHNIDGNTGFLHILSSSITKCIHNVHDLMPVMIERRRKMPPRM